MIACFDIGGSFIRYGLAGEDGLVAEAGRVATPTGSFSDFTAAMSAALDQMDAGPDAVLSLSLAGVFDPGTGVSTIANVPCCHGRPLASDLREALGRAVLIANDADCFALAEARLGRGAGFDNVFGIILGSGVGGGIVLNGKLVRGLGGITGEWGHGPVVDPGAGGLAPELEPVACGCGLTGCLDPVGSARGLERIDAALTGGHRRAPEILAAWHAGEPGAARVATVFVEQIARALATIVNVLGPAIVPVGGGLANDAGLIAAIDTRTRAMILARRDTPLVVPGDRRHDGGLVGAGLLAREASR